MSKVAIIEAKPSRNNYDRLFDNAFEFDRFALCSDPSVSKVLKRDVDIDIDIEEYDWIILVGSEPTKYYTKISSITSHTGRLVDDKFIPVINPAMLHFKPEAEKPWQESKARIIGYITGTLADLVIDYTKFVGIEDEQEAIDYIRAARNSKTDFIALDSETTALYPRNGYMIGLSITYEEDTGAYISTDCITEKVERELQELFYEKQVVFHNAKFDLSFFEYHFKFVFPFFHDTMLMHYALDETQGSHGLKELALKHTKYGDYEQELVEWRKSYCKAKGIREADFTYDLIPFDIIKQYAAIDTAVTFALYKKFSSYLERNPRLMGMYRNILLPGCRFLVDVQDNGVPFDKVRLQFAQATMSAQIEEAARGLKQFPEIAKMEELEGKTFNPNSTLQLRKLLFDYVGLKPTGKLTGTGAHSTDAEVLKELSELHEVPKYILELRKSSKIKNTYIDKIIPELDADECLRTNFNLSSTTSGRLSSSGKLNMQQLPRDNPIVKGCIKARDGYKIVAMDLTTAEMYIAAVESGDEELQEVFKSGGNFHSTIAKKVFNLDCPVEEVADKYPLYRQASKAISFGILYQASAAKIAESINKEGGNYSAKQAQVIINDYFSTFSKLKEWIDKTKAFIEDRAFIYSHFGRKRRLPNVRSDNKGVVGHEIRSGLNFVIQSSASDINLLGGIDTNNDIRVKGLDAKIFALVHDSVLAEVREDQVDEYVELLVSNIQKDRGLSIPGAPIGCDVDIADDYSIGKFDKVYGDRFKEFEESYISSIQAA